MSKRKSDDGISSNPEKLIVENKIRKVIETTFDEEINYKKYELEKINERIFEGQNMLDKLRACIICNYYSLNGRLTQNEYLNHPAIKNLKCEHLEMSIGQAKSSADNYNNANNQYSNTNNDSNNDDINSSKVFKSNTNAQIGYTQQYDIKICVGNVSKYLATSSVAKEYLEQLKTLDSSQYNQDLITHKWMVYIRSPDCVKLDNYIKKVLFFLHSSYKPYDIVEVKSSPFEITKRGWGEFPVHVQIHFKDSRNKRVDLSHNLKLDWTQTGLQTFGGETSISTKLVLKPNDFILKSTKVNETQTESINSQYIIDPVKNQQQALLAQIETDSNDSENSPLTFKPIISQSESTAAKDDSIVTEQLQQQHQQQVQQPQTDLATKTNNHSKTQEAPGDGTNEHIETKPIISNNYSNSVGLNLKNIGVVKPNAPLLNFQKPSTTSVPFYLEKKPAVIYKIEPNDLKKPSPTTTTPINTSNFLSTLKPTTSIKVVNLVNPTSASQPNATATISSKKITLSAEQLAKIKISSSIIKIEDQLKPSLDQKKQQQQIELDQEVKQQKVVVVEPTKQTVAEETKPVNVPIDANLIYTVENLKQKMSSPEFPNISFEFFVRQALTSCPLISKAGGDSRGATPQTPFSVESVHEFYSWPYPKRKAKEWMRALTLKQKCIQMIDNLGLSQRVLLKWSTKQVIMWLRAHGYTPLEYRHMMVRGEDERKNENERNFNYVNSFTPINRLFEYKKMSSRGTAIGASEKVKTNRDTMVNDEEADNDEFVDIINEFSTKKQPNEFNRKEKDAIEKEINKNDGLNFVEMSTGDRYVHDELDKLRIKTNTVNLVPSNETPSTSNLFKCNLVERFIFTVCRRFADDLIRQTCADQYFENPELTQTTSGLSNNSKKLSTTAATTTATASTTTTPVQNSNSATDLLQYQKFPQHLSVKDVYRTITKHDKYDFLTNKYMGFYDDSQFESNNEINLIRNNRIPLKKNYSDSSLINK